MSIRGYDDGHPVMISTVSPIVFTYELFEVNPSAWSPLSRSLSR